MIDTTPTPEMFRNNVFWVAKLSDGTTVFQRDDEPNHPGNGWKRLKKYVDSSNLDVVGLSIKFRDHQENLPENKEGYFFIRSLLASLSGVQFFYKLGYLENNVIYTTKYSIPELIEFEKDVSGGDDPLVQDYLIRNKNG